MKRNMELLRTIRATLRYHRKPLLGFHLYFSLLGLFLIGPFVGWLLNALVTLTGATLISNDQLVRFAFTTAGNFWLAISGVLFAVLVFLQVAGIILLVTRTRQG